MSPRWNKVINSFGVQPKPRHGHRAVAIKELIVIFGGGNEGILSDLIVFNTLKNEWFKPTVKGNIPAGRASYGFVVDRTRILVFGGMLEFMECTNELFELQASRWEWRKITPRGPPDLKPPPLPRLGHSFTLIGDKVYLFGGLTLDTDNTELNTFYPRYLNDLYTLDWVKDVISWNIPLTYGRFPSPRESHSAITHTDSQGNQRLIIYGGMSGCRMGDLWFLCINSMTWFEVENSGQTPIPRSLHTATVVGDQMFVFGGWVPVGETRSNYQEKEWKVTNQLLCFDLSSMKWKDISIFSPNDVPKARAGHSAVGINGRVYIWSGRDGYRRAWNNQVCCNDMWYLDIDIPPAMSRPQLLKGDLKFLEIQWTPVSSTDSYLLQIRKFDICSSYYNTEKSSLNMCMQKSHHHCDKKSKVSHMSNDLIPISEKETSDLVKFQTPNLPHPFSPANVSFSSHHIFPQATISSFPRLQMVSSKAHTLIHKLPSFEAMPTSNQNSYGIAFAMTNPTVPKPLPAYRPMTMSLLKANNLNNASQFAPKPFAVCKTANLVRLNNPLPQNSKQPTILVRNPAFKLVAVNKDSQIKLVQSRSSHVVNKIVASEKKLIDPMPSTSKDNKFDAGKFNIETKKPKLSFNSDSCESEVINSTKMKKAPELNEVRAYCSAASIQNKAPVDKHKSSDVTVLKLPSFPERVQIKKCKITEGIFLSWTPPPGDVVNSYKVTLFVKENISPTGQKVIYNGVRPECFILKSHLDNACIDNSGGTRSVKFTISAKNNLGLGPALVVKWVLHPSHLQK